MSGRVAWFSVLALCAGSAGVLVGCGGDAFSTANDGAGGGATGGGSSGGSATGGSATGGSGVGGSGVGGGATGGSSSGGSGSGGSATGGSGAGGGSTIVDPTDFDQSCTYDSDCEIVFGGDVCGCGSCLGTAISREAVDEFNALRDSITCDTSDPIACPAIACEQQLAACVSGMCTTRAPLYIQASHFDTTCTKDSDCHIIVEGEVCSSCQCGGAAVNTGSYEQYREMVESVECSPGPSACDCASVGEAYCDIEATQELGECVVGVR